MVLAPDYSSFGECADDPYQLGFVSATMMGIVSHIATVSVLSWLSKVKAARVGVIGHSLGGHNAIFLVVFDDRIGAVVCSCGLCTFASYRGGNLSGWVSRLYMPGVAVEFRSDPGLMPFDFPESLASLPPRPVLVSAPLRGDNFDCDGAKRCVDVARKACETRGYDLSCVVGIHPDRGHDFPPEARHEAYRFLENRLETL